MTSSKQADISCNRAIVMVVPLLSSIGCTTTSGQSADPAVRRQQIDSAADAALSRLKQEVPTSVELLDSAKGVLVFSDGRRRRLHRRWLAPGTGVLRKGGQTAGYFTTTALSVGLLAGGQSQAVFILFMTEDALKRFEASSGWTAGADGSVALINVGASAQVTTQTVAATHRRLRSHQLRSDGQPEPGRHADRPPFTCEPSLKNRRAEPFRTAFEPSNE